MAKGSNLSEVTFNPTTGTATAADRSSELRSISISGDGAGLIDATVIGNDHVSSIVGQQQQVTVTVVTLDEPSSWTRPTLGDQAGRTLTLRMGDSPADGSTDTRYLREYDNMVINDCSFSVGVDAVIEITWTFQMIGDPSE